MPPQAAQLALNALQAGNLAGAQTILARALRETPNDADILHLTGILYRRQGRTQEALALFERALAAAGDRPDIRNNLGITLASLGQLDKAEQCYREALKLDPNFPDAAYNLGLLLIERTKWPEARVALEQALTIRPEHARALDALGIVLRELSDNQAALIAATKAVALTPTSPSALHNLAQTYLALGRYEEAIPTYEKALALIPNSDATWIGLGHAHRALGSPEKAKTAYQNAVNINPGNPDAHRLLNEIVWQSGATALYLQSFPEALRQRPTDHRLRLAYANELLKINQHEAAGGELKLALNAAKNDADVLDAVARARAMAGDFKEASAFHGRALEAAPGNAMFVRNFAETLLKAKEHTAAHSVTSRGLERFPLEQGVLALHTTAQRLAGDPGHARLADYEHLPTVIEVEPPAGFPDIETFCIKLNDVLDRLHATKAHPTDQTLRGGTQTFGALFLNPDPTIQLLSTQLRKAIAGFIATLPEDHGHPFNARKRTNFDFSGSWSVKLRSGGFHTNHFHPKGWISSAFYVQMPPVAAGSNEAWFKMGETNLELGDREIIARLVEPKVGRLVLFPSYFWHGTVAFSSPSPRTTVAFDVVPN